MDDVRGGVRPLTGVTGASGPWAGSDLAFDHPFEGVLRDRSSEWASGGIRPLGGVMAGASGPWAGSDLAGASGPWAGSDLAFDHPFVRGIRPLGGVRPCVRSPLRGIHPQASTHPAHPSQTLRPIRSVDGRVG